MFNNDKNQNYSSTYDRNNINAEIFCSPADKSIVSEYGKIKNKIGEKYNERESRTPGFYPNPQTPIRSSCVHRERSNTENTQNKSSSFLRENSNVQNDCSTHSRGLMELGLRSTFLISDSKDEGIDEKKIEIDKKKNPSRPRHSLSLPDALFERIALPLILLLGF